MPAYLIVNYDVEDPKLYGEYSAAAGSVLKIGEDCKLLVLDPASEHLEGESAGKQTVVLSFDSMADAKKTYESGDYQALIPKRHAATSNHFAVLVNGLPG